MNTNSVIRLSDLHENKDAYRTASKQYYAVYILDSEGVFVPCLLTENDITTGVDRAVKNVEDILPLSFVQIVYHKTVLLLEKLKNKITSLVLRIKS